MLLYQGILLLKTILLVWEQIQVRHLCKLFFPQCPSLFFRVCFVTDGHTCKFFGFGYINLFNWVLLHFGYNKISPRVQYCSSDSRILIGHIWCIDIPTWHHGSQDKLIYLGLLICIQVSFGNWETKKILKILTWKPLGHVIIFNK